VTGVVGLAVIVTAACTAGTAANGGNGENGSGGSGTGSPGSDKYLNFFPCCSWGTTWSYNPYNVNGLTIQHGLITLPLAIQNYPSLTDYTPQLADKWAVSGNTLTVHVREDAKWQDNTSVTSKDVYDTALLDGTRGDALWNDITGVKIIDPHTVAFQLKSGQPVALAENDILASVDVYPSSVYGKFVTPQLEKDVPAYFQEEQKDPTKASAMPEFKRMGDTFKQVAALKVNTLIGDGPFKLNNITTKEAKLDRWSGFWAAHKIKFGGINYYNGDNQTIYPQLLSNNLDLAGVYKPPPILKQLESVPDQHQALPAGFGFVLGFNSSHYPLNMTAVRQALAYVIPRQQMTEAAYGTKTGGGGTWKQVNTGISPAFESLYLNRDQLDQLNTYPVDPDKATKLLDSKGFKKQNGQWLMPNGKPFTLTFTADASTSDIVTSFTSAAQALTAFGIKSDVAATSGAQQLADQHNGNFEAGIFFDSGSSPLDMYNFMMGPGQNFSSSGNYAGKRGIGFGPKVNVPGLGTVDIPTTLAKQASSTPPGQAMKEYTWDWARLVNQQVPYIWYGTKVRQYSYSTKNFDNWPPVDRDGSSQLWDIMGNNFTAGLSLAIQEGYITPKP